METSKWDELKKRLEYLSGTSGIGVKYLNRFGSPGNYSYIYPDDKINRYGRVKYRAFMRYLTHHNRFIQRINQAYNGRKISLKTISWHYQLATITRQEGSSFKLGINLRNHKIRSYRSKLRGPSASAHLNSLKRRGVLRYR